ncbi:electron transport complex subunit RsxG [Vibrio sp. UCD-FRSSP16_10]|uniref:electron transport complex subunit RsxG n=1 Tax=unclassified Vibrio TaxID=2614977 RepID=UPI0007FC1C75|nr:MULTISPECIES: electron transport complex subunit RsxG [unclassified Vibrio]OBT13073.1 electron transport complex subunit RsxG [Vibrio sp. UCD-FRSSP16_30]OBT19282.1 electron transport complex subunit RsxG [Vibrio sp. UCD-FRSSP16_10]
MFKTIQRNGLVLAMFACLTTGVVSITHLLTADKIKAQQISQLQGQLNQVIPTNLHDNELYANCVDLNNLALGSQENMPAYIATIDGKPTAVAIETIAPDGYSGAIKLLVGVDLQGKVLGARVLSQHETPGLGDKIDLRVSDWILAFADKIITADNHNSWKVRKDGGQFDQFTGATITPRAVVKAIYNTGLYFTQNQQQILSSSPQCEVK